MSRREASDYYGDGEGKKKVIGKNSVLSQILRQCKFRKDPVPQKDLETGLHKQMMMSVLQSEIREFQNLPVSSHRSNNSQFDETFRVTTNQRAQITLDPNRASNLAMKSIYGNNSVRYRNVRMDTASENFEIKAGEGSVDQSRGHMILDTSNSRINLK